MWKEQICHDTGVVHEKNRHVITLVDPCVVCEKNTHAVTLGVVHEKNRHAMTLVDPYVWFMKRTDMQWHWWILMWFV